MKKIFTYLLLITYILGTPVNALSGFYCGADLNGDGKTDAQGETAACSQATPWNGQAAQWFCPVQAVDCTAGTTGTAPTITHVCPDGTTYVASRDRCEGPTAVPNHGGVTVLGEIPQNQDGSWGPWSMAGIKNFTMKKDSATSWTISYQATFDLGHNEYVTYPWWDRNVAYTGGAAGTPDGNYFTHTMSAGQTFRETVTNGDATVSFTVDMGNGVIYLGGSGAAYAFQNLMVSLSCPSGLTVDPSQGNICYAPATTQATCSTGTYDAASNTCVAGNYTCPSGNYPCLDTGGSVPQCSPNPCEDIDAPGNAEEVIPPQDPYLQNDGARDANGNCLGQIYIFSGKATRCRPPGMSVGYANNCCASSQPVMTDSTTGSLSTTLSAITDVYHAAQVAYYTYEFSTGAMAITETASGGVVMTSVASGATVATIGSGATATGVVAGSTAAAAGATTGSALTSALTSYMGALLNPASIAIAIVVMVAMKVIFGSGCDQNDIETAMDNNSGRCHYIGDVCEEKWFTGCVQTAKRYCCFNSKMALLVQEQGRPQLKSFGPNGDWGTPESPNCRGFTPEEFQELDFSKIDLSSYFGDIEKNMAAKVQNAQAAISQDILNHYAQTQHN